jgi:hypothetical protein
LEKSLAVKLYWFQHAYPPDAKWVNRLVTSVPDQARVERRLLRRLGLRLQAGVGAVFDIISSFLESLIPPSISWSWVWASLMMLPIGWFLGARQGILSSMMEAAC